MTKSGPQLFILLHMYRRRVVESETETISDYVSTPTPCGRHWLAVQPQSPHFTLHSLFPPLAQVGNRFPRFSLLLCTPLAGFQFLHFFFYNRTTHLLYYITRKSWSQNFLLPVPSRPVPGPVQTKKFPCPAAQNKKRW